MTPLPRTAVLGDTVEVNGEVGTLVVLTPSEDGDVWAVVDLGGGRHVTFRAWWVEPRPLRPLAKTVPS